MLQVSPVRAFSDNYIWLIRAPADPAAAVDREVEDAIGARPGPAELGRAADRHAHGAQRRTGDGAAEGITVEPVR